MATILGLALIISLLFYFHSLGNRLIEEKEKEAQRVEQKKRREAKIKERFEEEQKESERLRNLEIDLLNKKLSPLFNQLQKQFEESIAKEILEELEKTEISIVYQIGKNFYDKSLDLILIHKGDVKSKLFSLDMGRFYYSRTSFWQNVSKQDEETIQNDIKIRS